MGGWVRRQGQGVQGRTNHWFTPRNKLQFGFRHLKVSNQLVLDRGTVTHASVRMDSWRDQVSVCVPRRPECRVDFSGDLDDKAVQRDPGSVDLSFWPRNLWRKNTSEQSQMRPRRTGAGERDGDKKNRRTKLLPTLFPDMHGLPQNKRSLGLANPEPIKERSLGQS